MAQGEWKMRTAAALVMALGLMSEPASARQTVDSDNARGAWDMIAFEMKSWGRPLESWRIIPTGTGSWMETRKRDGTQAAEYELVVHAIAVGAAGYTKVAAILADLPVPAPDSADCENFMTDMAYGTIRLTSGATTTEIAWNSGCMDETYMPLLDTLKEANSLMREWGKSGEVLRIEALP